MVTLVNVTREIRVIAKWASIVLGSLTLLILFIRFGLYIKNVFFPTPPPPPEQGFGKLPELSFSNKNLPNYTYRINTISGFLPVFPDRAKVYKFYESESFILTAFPIRDKLSKIGFTQNEKKIDEITYQWENQNNPRKKIIYNIVKNDFKIEYDFANDPNILASRFDSSKEQSTEAVQEMLEEIGEDYSDLDFDSTRFSFYRIENADPTIARLVEVDEKENPHVVKMDIRQKKIDDLSLLYETDKDYLINFYVAVTHPESIIKTEVIAGEYRHRKVIPEQNSSYPTKLAEYAFDELKKGKALLVKIPRSAQVDILDIYIAYFVSPDQKYLRPIVVFEGKDFLAYVDAILQAPPKPSSKSDK